MSKWPKVALGDVLTLWRAMLNKSSLLARDARGAGLPRGVCAARLGLSRRDGTPGLCRDEAPAATKSIFRGEPCLNGF